MFRPVSLALLLAATFAVAGCDTPVGALIGGAGPTISGTVKGMSGAAVRVGLIGTPRAGAKEREIASAATSGGSFTLTLPARPPIDLMEQPDEQRSIVFSLRAYEDRNANGAFDDGEPLCQCSSGSFRYFSSEGPAGSYKAGWNTFAGGRYSQSFDTAYVI